MLTFFKRQTESPRITQIRLLSLFATLSQRELRIIDGLLEVLSNVVYGRRDQAAALRCCMI